MNSQKLLREIGKQIAIKRNTAGMSQQGLSAKLFFNANHIAKYERGEINITLETLDKIASSLGCRVDIRLRKVSSEVKVEEEVWEVS